MLILFVFQKWPLLFKCTVSKAVYPMWKMCDAKNWFWPTLIPAMPCKRTVLRVNAASVSAQWIPSSFDSSFEKLFCFDEAWLQRWQHNKPLSAASYHQTSTKGLASSIPSEQFVFMRHCSRSTYLNASCRWFDFNHLAEVKSQTLEPEHVTRKVLFPDKHRQLSASRMCQTFLSVCISLCSVDPD